MRRGKKKPFRPTIACRVDQKIYDKCDEIAERREIFISKLLETMVEYYLLEFNMIEHDWKVRGDE